MSRPQSPPFWLNGAAHAIGAALLFGAAMPLCKLLLDQSDPWMLAGLLYLGSGLGLGGYRLLARLPRPKLTVRDLGWLGAAILSGGIVAPVLLMFALGSMNASSTSLLLNAEGLLTAALAWLAFREHIGRRIAIGMTLIAVGAIVLSWPTRHETLVLLPSALVLAAWVGPSTTTAHAAPRRLMPHGWRRQRAWWPGSSI